MKTTVLDKILDQMSDGEARTLTRIHYLTGVSLNSIRKALNDGHLVKVGEEPKPAMYARCGQAIVRIADEYLQQRQCSG